MTPAIEYTVNPYSRISINPATTPRNMAAKPLIIDGTDTDRLRGADKPTIRELSSKQNRVIVERMRILKLIFNKATSFFCLHPLYYKGRQRRQKMKIISNWFNSPYRHSGAGCHNPLDILSSKEYIESMPCKKEEPDKNLQIAMKEVKDIPKPQVKGKVKPKGRIGSPMVEPEVIPAVKTVKPMKMTANQIAYEALRSAGVNHYQTTKQLGLSKGYGYDTNGPAKKSYATMVEQLMPRSIKIIKQLAQGQSVGAVEEVKGSDVIAANKMIWDRVLPVVKHNGPVSLPTFINVNINLSEFGMTAPVVVSD